VTKKTPAEKQADEIKRRAIAEKYVRDCLAIMDGSAEAGIARIGWSGFEHTVKQVMKALP
jgi:hypothetical protein